MKKQTSLQIVSVLLAALIALAMVSALAGCDGGKKDIIVGGTNDIGTGSTVFVLEITDDTSVKTTFNVSTDESTVGAALLKLGLIAGEDSAYGLYIKTVNGLTADYDKDGAYWSFYVNGEYAMTGADSTEIEPGAVYGLVYTKG